MIELLGLLAMIAVFGLQMTGACELLAMIAVFGLQVTGACVMHSLRNSVAEVVFVFACTKLVLCETCLTTGCLSHTHTHIYICKCTTLTQEGEGLPQLLPTSLPGEGKGSLVALD